MATTSSMSACFFERLLDAQGHQALDANGAVVGADDQFVADLAELVFPEHQLFVAEADDADDIGAVLLVGARLRVDRGNPETAADADDFLRAAEMTGDAHRSDHGVQVAADLALLLHLPGGLADRLDDQGDGAAFAVEVGDGEGNSFSVRMRHHDDELAGLGGPRHHRMSKLEEVGDVGEILPRDNLKAAIGNSSTRGLVHDHPFPWTMWFRRRVTGTPQMRHHAPCGIDQCQRPRSPKKLVSTAAFRRLWSGMRGAAGNFGGAVCSTMIIFGMRLLGTANWPSKPRMRLSGRNSWNWRKCARKSPIASRTA